MSDPVPMAPTNPLLPIVPPLPQQPPPVGGNAANPPTGNSLDNLTTGVVEAAAKHSLHAKMKRKNRKRKDDDDDDDKAPITRQDQFKTVTATLDGPRRRRKDTKAKQKAAREARAMGARKSSGDGEDDAGGYIGDINEFGNSNDDDEEDVSL